MGHRKLEPVVRIRVPSAEDGARCRAVLEAAGLAPEASLSWLLVRNAHPDHVNEVLVAGGALGRVAAREQIGKLVGWLIDRDGHVEGRGAALQNLVKRVLSEAGLQSRYVPRSEARLLAAAAELYEDLMAQGAPFLSWERFLGFFCEPVASA